MIHFSREARAESVSQELAGMFEIGGSYSFDVSTQNAKNGVARTYVYPQLALGDTNREKLEVLKDWFGGSISSKHTRAYQWVKKGKGVLPIVEKTLTYAPFREDFITAFQLWEMAEDIDEKLLLANELGDMNRQENKFPDPQVYEGLVLDSRFLAGCYFARGAIRSSHRINHQHRPRVMFHSGNRSLLEAIKGQFGGNLSHNEQNGYTIDINNPNTFRLVESIAPHLLYSDQALGRFIS
jgi:hypothetical protein